MKFKFFLITLLAGITSSTAVAAHPQSSLLTVGGVKEGSDSTAGVSIEEINGVHIYRGTARLEGNQTLAPLAGGARRTVEIEIISTIQPWRSFRSLRTQGFYSGVSPKSRHFTQGFYSGS